MNNENQNNINNMANPQPPVPSTPVEQSAPAQAPVTPVVQNAAGAVPEVESMVTGTKCPRCGFNITGDNKMCLHCGFVIGEPEAKGIATASTINNDPNADVNTEVVVEHIDYAAEARKKRLPILLINIIPTALIILLFIYCMFTKQDIISDIPNIFVGLYGIISWSIICFYMICYELILVKADLPWWGIYIPVYGVFLNSRLMTDNSCYFLLWYLPAQVYVTIIDLMGLTPPTILTLVLLGYVIFMNVKMILKFANRFGANPFLVLFFPYVMIPIIAFNDRYQGV